MTRQWNHFGGVWAGCIGLASMSRTYGHCMMQVRHRQHGRAEWSRLGLVVMAGLSLTHSMASVAQPEGPADRDRQRDVASPNAFQTAIDAALPAVVKLYGTGAGRQHGYGTGVLVSSDGHVMTTLSILVTSRNLRVVLRDGRTLPGRVLRTDSERNLALIDVEGEDFPHLSPVTTEGLQVGDTLIALGNWYKIAEGSELVSVNRGILSMRTRLDARRLAQDFEYRGPVLVYDLLTANPGAPGGPVLDIDGNFVGLVGRLVEATQANVRLNYALPGEELAAFLGGEASDRVDRPSPADSGEQASRPDVGVKISRLGFRHVAAYVERVRPGSPAATAGVQPDDLVMAINGRRIADADDYERIAGELMPGQNAVFLLKRGDDVITVRIEVGERK